MAKLKVFPPTSHHLHLAVITCIVRASVLDWTLACCKYSHISWDHNIFTVNVLCGRWFWSFGFKQNQYFMIWDQVFGSSKVIEQKQFCFFRFFLSILVISRIFKYAITENKFERVQHKCFCTIDWSRYYEAFVFSSSINE